MRLEAGGEGENGMIIDHAALYALDIDKLGAFYERYFGGEPGRPYHNPKTGLRSLFLRFGDGARLELMVRPEVEPRPEGPVRQGFAHLSFKAGSKEAVDLLTERLRADGYAVLSNPRVTGDGYYESCVLDPEGNQAEIVA